MRPGHARAQDTFFSQGILDLFGRDRHVDQADLLTLVNGRCVAKGEDEHRGDPRLALSARPMLTPARQLRNVTAGRKARQRRRNLPNPARLFPHQFTIIAPYASGLGRERPCKTNSTARRRRRRRPAQKQRRAPTVRDHVRRTAEDVQEQLASAAENTKEQVGEVAESVKARAHAMAGDRKATGAEQLSGLARAINLAADELQDELPEAAGYVREAAARVDNVSTMIRERSIEDLIHEANDFARSNAVAFFGISVVAGNRRGSITKTGSFALCDRSRRPLLGEAAAKQRHADKNLKRRHLIISEKEATIVVEASRPSDGVSPKFIAMATRSRSR